MTRPLARTAAGMIPPPNFCLNKFAITPVLR